MKASLFSYVISAALSFATIATASKPVENDTISSKKNGDQRTQCNAECFGCKQAP